MDASKIVFLTNYKYMLCNFGYYSSNLIFTLSILYTPNASYCI